MVDQDRMTKGERQELGQLIRKRERVMKAQVAERGAAMLAEFENQCGSIYSFDQDETWAKAMQEAEKAVADANEVIAARCKEMGIPKEFAPSVLMGWFERGQNAVAARRTELRRMAKTRIVAIEKEAISKIERLSLEAQTEVISNGLVSTAAKDFLERMPTLDVLMPSLDAQELKKISDRKHKRQLLVTD